MTGECGGSAVRQGRHDRSAKPIQCLLHRLAKVVFKADVASGVFVAARAVIEGVDLPAGTAVPSLVLTSQDQVRQLSETSPQQREFMQDVVQANLKLTEGYLKQS